MLLDLTETKKLVELLQMGNHRFEQIEEAALKLGSADGGGRLCMSLRCMMHDNYYRASDSEHHSELLITAFVLWSIGSKSQMPGTKSVVYTILQQLEGDLRERKGKERDDMPHRQRTALKVFILACMSEQLSEPSHRSKTPNQYLCMEPAQMQAEHMRLQQQCKAKLVSGLEAARCAHDEELSFSTGGFLSKGVSPCLVVHEGQPEPADILQQGLQHTDPVMRFEPPCDRPRPPPFPLTEGELSFLHTRGLPADLIWDASMGSTSDDLLELREIIEKAHQCHQTEEETAVCLQKLRENSQHLLSVGCSPSRLPELVDKNPQVVSVFINLLFAEHVEAAEEMLSVLVHMDMCLPVCESLLALLHDPGTAVAELLPGGRAEDFVEKFVTRAINSSAKQGSNVQRLLVTFCSKVLHHKPTAPLLDAVREPLKAFCIDHAANSHATKLFKMLTGGDQ
eukprot:TRINITY_DN2468_c0_g1_i5.p1 TRINITY_DN2468_c0_g1~~TRINITY_DN2468_c0_g1_i5.p1  ORF type:complete len:479 (+),score=187.42 TRINITY_DN2468_c0_g1_i5:79-1437(+)